MQGKELQLFLQEGVPGSPRARGMPRPSTTPRCSALLRVTYWCWGHWGRRGHWGCQGWRPSPLGAGGTRWPTRPPAPFSPQPRASHQPSPFLGKKKPNLGSLDARAAGGQATLPRAPWCWAGHGGGKTSPRGNGAPQHHPAPGSDHPSSSLLPSEGPHPRNPPANWAPGAAGMGRSHSSPAPWGPGTPLSPSPWGSPANGFCSGSIAGGLGVPRHGTAASSHAAPCERLQRDPRQKSPSVPKRPQNASGEAAPLTAGGARAQGGSGDLQAAPPAG